MKIEATEGCLTLTSENDFDVMALNIWRSKKIRAFIETYKKDELRFGEKAKHSGFLRVDFDDCIGV
jgi:hypothetical protein